MSDFLVGRHVGSLMSVLDVRWKIRGGSELDVLEL